MVIVANAVDVFRYDLKQGGIVPEMLLELLITFYRNIEEPRVEGAS
jgi:hypothetical protein